MNASPCTPQQAQLAEITVIAAITPVRWWFSNGCGLLHRLSNQLKSSQMALKSTQIDQLSNLSVFEFFFKTRIFTVFFSRKTLSGWVTGGDNSLSCAGTPLLPAMSLRSLRLTNPRCSVSVCLACAGARRRLSQPVDLVRAPPSRRWGEERVLVRGRFHAFRYVVGTSIELECRVLLLIPTRG